MSKKQTYSQKKSAKSGQKNLLRKYILRRSVFPRSAYGEIYFIKTPISPTVTKGRLSISRTASKRKYRAG